MHTYAYCPRLSFFETYVGRRRGLLERLRLLLGRLYHAAFLLRDLFRKARREERLSVEVASGVVLRGRADALHIGESSVRVIERKSTRAPRHGAWVSDVLQASAYGFIMLKRGFSDVLIEIRYPTTSRIFRMDRRIMSALLMAIDDLVLIKRYGIVPSPKRGPRCYKCPFREVCFKLDEELTPEEGELYEPGSWLTGINVID
ncbi:MAG: Dna2/Cas4 domain-containing protein [Acidilobus sp.]